MLQMIGGVRGWGAVAGMGGGGELGSQPEKPCVRTMVTRSRFVKVFQRLLRCSNREVGYLTSLKHSSN